MSEIEDVLVAGMILVDATFSCFNYLERFIYSHFKQVCDIRLYLQTLSEKGMQ